MTTTTSPRAPRPVPGPARDYHFPHFERAELPNGLRIVVAPIRRLPIASVLAVVDAGALWDARGREGTASITAKMLLEGAGTLEGAELTERFERLGATMEAGAEWDASVVSMTATTQRLAEAFGLFATVIRHPLFRQREIERMQSERLADLLQQRAELRGLADESFEAAVYHATSRYSISLGGSAESVEDITATDIGSLYAARYTPATTTLIVAGDVDMKSVIALARPSFGDWTGTAPRGAARTDRAARATRATHLIARPDAHQSEVRVGHVAVPRTHPDYFDIVVMNAILGGLFNSRINLNLREAHAYTYGAFSAFDWRRDAGPFVVSTAVRTDVTTEAIAEIINEIERLRREVVPEHELSLALSYLDGVFPIRYETTAAVAAALANQVIHGLPDDYFDAYRARIRGVTADSVLAAAKQHLAPDRLQAVVVGDPSITEKLRALGFGDFISAEPSST
ncbi:MAG: pitrilysin family protein [Gemmatimonadaceae bacterium]